MIPLKRGALTEKLLAFVLASATIFSSSPVLAQGSESATGSGDDVSIRTLPPLNSSSPSGSGGLTYTPDASAAAPAADPRIPRGLPQFESTADILAGSQGDGSISAGQPAVSNAPSTREPTPAEAGTESTAAAEPAEPTAIAQGSPAPIQEARRDPFRRHLPLEVGSVQVRKPFKLFAREELIRSLSFRDTPVKEVIAEIARRGNLNILIDKSAVGRLTGELRDVTLNEAMDSVLASSGLQSRVLDNNTVIVGTYAAMTQMGLNRTAAKAFKLSYAHPWDVASVLYSSVFNRGYIPDFNTALRRRISGTDRGENTQRTETTTETELRTTGEGGAKKIFKEADRGINLSTELSEDLKVDENNQINRLDTPRTIRGTSRSQLQEGVGFNNAATDPGSQQIRQLQETPSDYTVEQNGGGAVVIPDVKNRQVIVVGTPQDLAVAEETINLLDRRPKVVHIQSSLIELTNQAIRQLGASVQTQGGGASAFVLGQQAAGTVVPIPGQPATVPSQVGPVQANTTATIAGVTSSTVAQSLFNLLNLSRNAGGRINMATFPTAINVTVNELLQTNKAKLIANPSVVVVDNTEALVTLANEVIHKITTTSNLGVTTTNVELTKAGIFLNVMPKVTQDGFIRMRLRPQVSSPLGAPIVFGEGTPNQTVVTLLNIREIISEEIRIKDGQTLVLGGLFTENEAANLAKIPYVSEMPILGALFRNSLKGRNRTELILMITPKIVEEEPPLVTESGNVPQM